MSRILLLIILATWLTAAERIIRPSFKLGPALGVFIAGFVLLVLGVGVVAQHVSRQVLNTRIREALDRFHWVSLAGRLTIPAWLMFGVFGPAAWADNVLAVFGSRYQLVPLLIGTAPPLLAWVALTWAEYPADRAIREQNMVKDLERGLPVHAVPSAGRQLRMQVRQQLLPSVVPLLLIILVRDAVVWANGGRVDAAWGNLIMFPAVAAVYLIAPELFRWLFDAERLPDGDLRRRLDALCRRAGLRYRDILLWRTDHLVANAMVVGILPAWRYVLLSDRLLETMPDREIEAVFAHELGHIVHRHLSWFLVFFLAVVAAGLGPGLWLDHWLAARFPRLLEPQLSGYAVAYPAAALALTLLLLGVLSRRFERQADVYAARMMESRLRGPEASPLDSPLRWAVGDRGARALALALKRVAHVNGMPRRGWEFFHPGIGLRIQYLRELSGHPARTYEFDRRMQRLYGTLLLVLLTCGLIALHGLWMVGR